ncbi:MAG: nucleotide exchange factor GrpE [Candidatus Omnitrophica bacterium]|nr:nucleotide exchange factor GrpE [Candidatus Omnitrophota bacterium]
MENDDQKDKPDSTGAGEAKPEAVQPELEKLRQELGEAKDRYIRLFAEFDNVRKRNERERQELIKYAHEEVIIELLGLYEDFERCVAAARQNQSEGAVLLKGVEMTLKRMQELFKKYDVRPIEALGKKFDHSLHEALMTAESADHDEDTVIEVFQNGYMLGERVARTAKVKVSKRPAAAAEEPGPEINSSGEA